MPENALENVRHEGRIKPKHKLLHLPFAQNAGNLQQGQRRGRSRTISLAKVAARDAKSHLDALARRNQTSTPRTRRVRPAGSQHSSD
jgi:hypothetical protein